MVRTLQSGAVRMVRVCVVVHVNMRKMPPPAVSSKVGKYTADILSDLSPHFANSTLQGMRRA